MSPKQLLKFYGTQSQAAAALGVSQPAISNWVTRGVIPELQQLRIEHATNGALRAKKYILPAAQKVSH